MSDDDLHARLVRVFHDAATSSCATEDDWNLLADAVIRELGLKQQWLCQHREYNEPPVILSGNPLVQHRYVTDWIAND